VVVVVVPIGSAVSASLRLSAWHNLKVVAVDSIH
jgi:hypothetical protein